MHRTALLLCTLALVTAVACAPTVPLVLTPEAQRIQVGQADPGQGYVVVQGIDAIDGSGCGAFGSRGTFNGALFQLRYDAALVHADYIKIISTKEPYGDQHCFHNEYSISAIAYKKTDAAGTP